MTPVASTTEMCGCPVFASRICAAYTETLLLGSHLGSGERLTVVGGLHDANADRVAVGVLRMPRHVQRAGLIVDDRLPRSVDRVAVLLLLLDAAMGGEGQAVV